MCVCVCAKFEISQIIQTLVFNPPEEESPEEVSLKWNWCKEIVKFQYIIEIHEKFRTRTKLLLIMFKIALILFIYYE